MKAITSETIKQAMLQYKGQITQLAPKKARGVKKTYGVRHKAGSMGIFRPGE